MSVEDDGVVVTLRDGEQVMTFRVGPVFYGEARQPDGTGVWIDYQEKHRASQIAGPVLVTPAEWRELSAAVSGRLWMAAWRRAPWWRKLLMALARDSRAFR